MAALIHYFVDGSSIAQKSAAYAVAKAINRTIVSQWSARIRVSDPQTNQYAELVAIREACADIQTHHPNDPNITIYSDSDYAIKCITLWGPTWKAQGWRRKAGGGGKPLEHLGVIGPLVDFVEANKERVRFEHVRAHQLAAQSKIYPYSGNALVDRLARASANAIDIDTNSPV